MGYYWSESPSSNTFRFHKRIRPSRHGQSQIRRRNLAHM